MRVTTESGAVYEFTKNGDKVRRLTKRNPVDPEAEVERVPMNQDGKWRTLFAPAVAVVGQQMLLSIIPEEDTGSIKFRQTSVVVGIEE